MIRLAKMSDLPRLWPLVADYMASQVELGAPDQHHAVENCVRFGISTGEAVFVAEDFGEIVGFCAWMHHDGCAKDEVAALGTYVVPEHRGRRLSLQLREAAKEHCRQRGYRIVTGAVLDANPVGVESARRSGARAVGSLIRWEL